MAIKPLECYDRRVLISTPGQLKFNTTKGDRLIIPGTLFGLRYSYDGTKIRCILNDDIQRVFTVDYDDAHLLQEHSIPAEEAKELGYI